MRLRFALVLIVFAAPASAGCRLSTADCAIIAREAVIEAVAQQADAATFAPNMLSYPRGRELIKRHYARLDERTKHLPVRIGNEWARMGLCDAVASANAESPSSTPIPAQCR